MLPETYRNMMPLHGTNSVFGEMSMYLECAMDNQERITRKRKAA